VALLAKTVLLLAFRRKELMQQVLTLAKFCKICAKFCYQHHHNITMALANNLLYKTASVYNKIKKD